MIKLRYFAPLLTVAMLVVILVYEAWQIHDQLTRREWAYAQSSLHDVASRTQASLARRYKEGNSVGVEQIMSEIRVFNRETEAYLIGPDDRVLAADRLGVGAVPVAKLPVAIDPVKLRQVRSSLQGAVGPDSDDLGLIAYYPVSLASSLERPFSKTGVLVVNLHNEQGMAEVQELVEEAIKRSLLVVLVLAGVLSLWIHLFITRRVNRLVEASNRYARGELDARSEDVSGDEIGEIAAAFNRMADAAAEKQRSLAQSEAQLRELNETLEQRIADRTAELSSEVEERRRIELALRESENELLTILNVAPDGIVVSTESGVITKFNHAAEVMFGWPEAEMLGNKVNRLGVAGALMRIQAGDASQGNTLAPEREVEALDRDGEVFPVALSVNKFMLRDGLHYIGILRDIRERRAAQDAVIRAQHRLLEAEKMAALGGLVAGVAHEVNTPVGVGVTAVSHLREELDGFGQRYRAGEMKRSDLDQLLATSEQSAQIIFDNLIRASELIRSFKEIAVDQTGEDVRDVQLGEYLGRVLTSLQPRIKNRPLSVTCSVEPSDLIVRLQAGGISQIATNLVMNSLTHAFAPGEAGEIGFAVSRKGDGIELVYYDTGKGMPADVAGRIFDPFFTTKRGQGGSGLGMHIVFNLVTQTYGGEIRCESAPGEGARFTITIPDCLVGATIGASGQ